MSAMDTLVNVPMAERDERQSSKSPQKQGGYSLRKQVTAVDNIDPFNVGPRSRMQQRQDGLWQLRVPGSRRRTEATDNAEIVGGFACIKLLPARNFLRQYRYLVRCPVFI